MLLTDEQLHPRSQSLLRSLPGWVLFSFLCHCVQTGVLQICTRSRMFGPGLHVDLSVSRVDVLLTRSSNSMC